MTANPIIEFFTASDTIVPPDTEITLSWSVINVTGLTLNGADVTGTNSLTLTPASTTTYTLEATNAQGGASQQVLVSVIIPGEPIISEFSAANIGPLLDEDGASSDWIEILQPERLDRDPQQLLPERRSGRPDQVAAAGHDSRRAGIPPRVRLRQGPVGRRSRAARELQPARERRIPGAEQGLGRARP